MTWVDFNFKIKVEVWSMTLFYDGKPYIYLRMRCTGMCVHIGFLELFTNYIFGISIQLHK